MFVERLLNVHHGGLPITSLDFQPHAAVWELERLATAAANCVKIWALHSHTPAENCQAFLKEETTNPVTNKRRKQQTDQDGEPTSPSHLSSSPAGGSDQTETLPPARAASAVTPLVSSRKRTDPPPLGRPPLTIATCVWAVAEHRTEIVALRWAPSGDFLASCDTEGVLFVYALGAPPPGWKPKSHVARNRVTARPGSTCKDAKGSSDTACAPRRDQEPMCYCPALWGTSSMLTTFPRASRASQQQKHAGISMGGRADLRGAGGCSTGAGPYTERWKQICSCVCSSTVGHVFDMCWCYDSRTVALGGGLGKICIVDIALEEMVVVLSLPGGDSAMIKAVSWDPQASLLAAQTGDKKVYVWRTERLASGKKGSHFSWSCSLVSQQSELLGNGPADTLGPRRLSWHPQGTFLAVPYAERNGRFFGCFLRVDEKADENTNPNPSADLKRSNSASIPSKDPPTTSENREGKAQGHPTNDLFSSTRPLRLRGHHRPVSLVRFSPEVLFADQDGGGAASAGDGSPLLPTDGPHRGSLCTLYAQASLDGALSIWQVAEQVDSEDKGQQGRRSQVGGITGTDGSRLRRSFPARCLGVIVNFLDENATLRDIAWGRHGQWLAAACTGGCVTLVGIPHEAIGARFGTNWLAFHLASNCENVLEGVAVRRSSSEVPSTSESAEFYFHRGLSDPPSPGSEEALASAAFTADALSPSCGCTCTCCCCKIHRHFTFDPTSASASPATVASTTTTSTSPAVSKDGGTSNTKEPGRMPSACASPVSLTITSTVSSCQLSSTCSRISTETASLSMTSTSVRSQQTETVTAAGKRRIKPVSLTAGGNPSASVSVVKGSEDLAAAGKDSQAELNTSSLGGVPANESVSVPRPVSDKPAAAPLSRETYSRAVLSGNAAEPTASNTTESPTQPFSASSPSPETAVASQLTVPPRAASTLPASPHVGTVVASPPPKTAVASQTVSTLGDSTGAGRPDAMQGEQGPPTTSSQSSSAASSRCTQDSPKDRAREPTSPQSCFLYLLQQQGQEVREALAAAQRLAQAPLSPSGGQPQAPFQRKLSLADILTPGLCLTELQQSLSGRKDARTACVTSSSTSPTNRVPLSGLPPFQREQKERLARKEAGEGGQPFLQLMNCQNEAPKERTAQSSAQLSGSSVHLDPVLRGFVSPVQSVRPDTCVGRLSPVSQPLPGRCDTSVKDQTRARGDANQLTAFGEGVGCEVKGVWGRQEIGLDAASISPGKEEKCVLENSPGKGQGGGSVSRDLILGGSQSIPNAEVRKLLEIKSTEGRGRGTVSPAEPAKVHKPSGSETGTSITEKTLQAKVALEIRNAQEAPTGVGGATKQPQVNSTATPLGEAREGAEADRRNSENVNRQLVAPSSDSVPRVHTAGESSSSIQSRGFPVGSLAGADLYSAALLRLQQERSLLFQMLQAEKAGASVVPPPDPPTGSICTTSTAGPDSTGAVTGPSVRQPVAAAPVAETQAIRVSTGDYMGVGRVQGQSDRRLHKPDMTFGSTGDAGGSPAVSQGLAVASPGCPIPRRTQGDSSVSGGRGGGSQVRSRNSWGSGGSAAGPAVGLQHSPQMALWLQKQQLAQMEAARQGLPSQPVPSPSERGMQHLSVWKQQLAQMQAAGKGMTLQAAGSRQAPQVQTLPSSPSSNIQQGGPVVTDSFPRQARPFLVETLRTPQTLPVSRERVASAAPGHTVAVPSKGSPASQRMLAAVTESRSPSYDPRIAVNEQVGSQASLSSQFLSQQSSLSPSSQQFAAPSVSSLRRSSDSAAEQASRGAGSSWRLSSSSPFLPSVSSPLWTSSTSSVSSLSRYEVPGSPPAATRPECSVTGASSNASAPGLQLPPSINPANYGVPRPPGSPKARSYGQTTVAAYPTSSGWLPPVHQSKTAIPPGSVSSGVLADSPDHVRSADSVAQGAINPLLAHDKLVPSSRIPTEGGSLGDRVSGQLASPQATECASDGSHGSLRVSLTAGAVSAEEGDCSNPALEQPHKQVVSSAADPQCRYGGSGRRASFSVDELVVISSSEEEEPEDEEENRCSPPSIRTEPICGRSPLFLLEDQALEGEGKPVNSTAWSCAVVAHTASESVEERKAPPATKKSFESVSSVLENSNAVSRSCSSSVNDGKGENIPCFLCQQQQHRERFTTSSVLPQKTRFGFLSAEADRNEAAAAAGSRSEVDRGELRWHLLGYEVTWKPSRRRSTADVGGEQMISTASGEGNASGSSSRMRNVSDSPSTDNGEQRTTAFVIDHMREIQEMDEERTWCTQSKIKAVLESTVAQKIASDCVPRLHTPRCVPRNRLVPRWSGEQEIARNDAVATRDGSCENSDLLVSENTYDSISQKGRQGDTDHLCASMYLSASSVSGGGGGGSNSSGPGSNRSSKTGSSGGVTPSGSLNGSGASARGTGVRGLRGGAAGGGGDSEDDEDDDDMADGLLRERALRKKYSSLNGVSQVKINSNPGNKQSGARNDSNLGDRSNLSIQSDDAAAGATTGQPRERSFSKKKNSVTVGGVTNVKTNLTGNEPSSLQKTQADNSRGGDDVEKLKPNLNGDHSASEARPTEKPQSAGSDWKSWNPFRRRLNVLRQLEEEEDEEDGIEGDELGVADPDNQKRIDINHREEAGGADERVSADLSSPPVASSSTSGTTKVAQSKEEPSHQASGGVVEAAVNHENLSRDLSRGRGGGGQRVAEECRFAPAHEGDRSGKSRGRENCADCPVSPPSITSSSSTTHDQDTISCSIPGERSRGVRRGYREGREEDMLSPASSSDTSHSDRSVENRQKRRKQKKLKRFRSRDNDRSPAGFRVRHVTAEMDGDKGLDWWRRKEEQGDGYLSTTAKKCSCYTSRATMWASSEEESRPGESRTATEFEGWSKRDHVRRRDATLQGMRIRRQRRARMNCQEEHGRKKACTASYRDRWQRKTREGTNRNEANTGERWSLANSILVPPPLLRDRVEVTGRLQGTLNRVSVVAVNRPQQKLQSRQGIACMTDLYATESYEQNEEETEKEKYGSEMESGEEIQHSSSGPELVCYLSSTLASDSSVLDPPDRRDTFVASLDGTTTQTEEVLWRFRVPAEYVVTHMTLSADTPSSTASKGGENCGDSFMDKGLFPSRSSALSSHLLVFIQPLSVMLFNHRQQHRHHPIGYSSRSFATLSHKDDRKATDVFSLPSPRHVVSSRHSPRHRWSRSHSQLPPDAPTNPPSYPWASGGWRNRKTCAYNGERRAHSPLVTGESLLSPPESELRSASDTILVKRRRSGVSPGLLYVFDLQTGIAVCPVTEIPLLPGSSVALCQWARVDFGSLLNGPKLAREELTDLSTESLKKNPCGISKKTTSLIELSRCIVILTTCAQLYVFTAPAVFYSRHGLTSEENPERKEMPTTLRRNTSGTPERGLLSHSKPGMDVAHRQGGRSASVSGQGHFSKGEFLSTIPAFCQPLVLLRKADLASTCLQSGACVRTDLNRDGDADLPPFCRSPENKGDCRKLPNAEIGLCGSHLRPDSIVWVEIQPRCLWLDSLLGLSQGALLGSIVTQASQMEKTVSENSSEIHRSSQGNKGTKEMVTARPSFAATSRNEKELSANSELQEFGEKMGFVFRQAWLQVIVGCTSGKIWASSPPRMGFPSFERKLRVALQSDHCCSAPFEFSYFARRNGLESGIFKGGSEGVCTEKPGINERKVSSGVLSSFLDPCQYSGESFVRIDELPFQDSDFFSLLDWSQLGRRVLRASAHAHGFPSTCTPETFCVNGYVGGAPPRQNEEKTASTRAWDCPADNEVRCEDAEIHRLSPDSRNFESFRDKSLSRSRLERLELQHQQNGVSTVSSCLRSVNDSGGVVKPHDVKKRQSVTCTPSAAVKPFERRPLRVLQKRMVLADACGSVGRSLMRSVCIDLSDPAQVRFLRKVRSGSRLSSVLNTAAAVALAGSGAACNYGNVLWGHSPVLVNGGDATTATGQAEDFSYHGSLCRQQLEHKSADSRSSVRSAGCLGGDSSWSMAGGTNFEPTRIATEQETRSSLPLRGGRDAISRDCSSKEQREDEGLRERGNAYENLSCEPSRQQSSAPPGECRGGFNHHAVEAGIQLREVDQKLQRSQQILLNFLIHGRVLGPEFARLLNTTPTALKSRRLEVCEELSRRLQEIAKREEENEEARSDGNSRQEIHVLQKKASDRFERGSESTRETNAIHTPPQHPVVESHHRNASEEGGGPDCEMGVTTGGSELEGEQRESENRGEMSAVEERERDEETSTVSGEARTTGAKSEGIATMTQGVRPGEDDEEAVEVVTIDSEEDDIQEEESSKAEGDTDEEETDQEETPEQESTLETDDEQSRQTSGGQRLTLQHLEHQVCSSLAISSVPDLLFWLPALLRRQAELLLLPQLRATALSLLFSYWHSLTELCTACEKNEELIQQDLRGVWRSIRSGSGSEGRMNGLTRSLRPYVDYPPANSSSNLTCRGREEFLRCGGDIMSADGLERLLGRLGALENRRYGESKATTSERLSFLRPGGKLEMQLMDWGTLGALHLDPERLGSLVLQVLQTLREQGDRRTVLPQNASIANGEGGGSKAGSQQTQRSCEGNSEGVPEIQTVSAQPRPNVHRADRGSTAKDTGVGQDNLRLEHEDAQWIRGRHQDKEGKADERDLSCEGGGVESLTATAFEEVEAAVRAILGAIRVTREAVRSKMVSLADLLNDRRAALLALTEMRECRKREERRERSRSLGWICEASSDEEELLERNAVVSELLDSVF
ncbi:wd g-beta repeat-containing protein [Cystoisospora suis]|uniref:Wd g-beta repeat-containing protein n=1 Tax=Cystoisospora suis TaxID=483139 RepID=A0A2C6KT23_9APIC|nr:wd g-beta repeat-containing protein [Cystoisospora suis]